MRKIVILILTSIIISSCSSSDTIKKDELFIEKDKPPHLWSHHLNLSVSVEVCALKGNATLSTLGFTNIVQRGFFNYGNFEGYRAVIKCVKQEEKSFVYLAVAGKNKDIVEKLRNEIVSHIYTLKNGTPVVKSSSTTSPTKIDSVLSISECKFNYDISLEDFIKTFSLKKQPVQMSRNSGINDKLPESVKRRINKSYFRFKEYGIWVFFNSNDKFNSLRFEAPFTGTIGGVRIGETLSNLGQKKGRPDTEGANGLIYRDNGRFINYQSNNERIDKVFTNRCD